MLFLVRLVKLKLCHIFSKVPLPFSTFIGYCMDLLQDRENGEDNPRHSHKNRPEVCGIEQTDCCIREAQQIYLAQVD